MYKIVKLDEKELENYKGVIIAVIETNYNFDLYDHKVYKLTCLVEEKDTLSSDPAVELLNEKPEDDHKIINYDDFKEMVINHMKKRNPMLADGTGLIFSQSVLAKANIRIFSCDFTCDCEKYVLTYNASNWTLYNKWHTPISLEDSIDKCLDYLWLRIKEGQ